MRPSLLSNGMRSFRLELILALATHVNKCVEEVGHGEEEDEQVCQAEVDLEKIKDVRFRAIGIMSDWERKQEDDSADEVLDREGETQAGDADPLKGINFILESHLQIDPVEVSHKFSKAADDDPVDDPIVLIETGYTK